MIVPTPGLHSKQVEEGLFSECKKFPDGPVETLADPGDRGLEKNCLSNVLQ